MRQSLQLHPHSHCDALTDIVVELSRVGRTAIAVRFTARGDISKLSHPPLRSSTRADELWKSTCFEAFLRAMPTGAYYEFNFSPSTEWAVYRFAEYRDGRTVADNIVPQIETAHSHEQFELRAHFDLQQAADVSRADPWRLGLSAAITEMSGSKSYWALRHPRGKPDFHHSDCFALELPPPCRA